VSRHPEPRVVTRERGLQPAANLLDTRPDSGDVFVEVESRQRRRTNRRHARLRGGHLAWIERRQGLKPLAQLLQQVSPVAPRLQQFSEDRCDTFELERAPGVLCRRRCQPGIRRVALHTPVGPVDRVNRDDIQRLW
jgi:hypothetical protein